MADEDRKKLALNKLSILQRAVARVHEEQSKERELHKVAWQILHDMPGIDMDDWKIQLFREHASDMFDVFGNDTDTIIRRTTEWWEKETYEDPDTGKCETYKDWADTFATEKAVQVYDELASFKTKLRQLASQE